ncbi:MAG: hypothetical protein H6567_05745 [Lewinellaceae bacterium]|nr:hypothetical protein [Lewinellaceae bacterium]
MNFFRHILPVLVAVFSGSVLVANKANAPTIMSIQVFAGNDMTICMSDVLNLADLGATISGDVTDGDWISLGDGHFLPSNTDKVRFSVGTTYYPGPNDKLIGQFKLLLISDAPSPSAPNEKVTDYVNINLQVAPALTCNSNVNISLDEGCEQVINVNMVSPNPVPPFTSYQITLYDENNVLIPNKTLTSKHLDHTITYKLGHNCTNNVCWGNIKVEDYFPPIFVCKNDTISCFESDLPEIIGFPIPKTAVVDTFINKAWIIKNWDKCSDVILTSQDSVSMLDCDHAFDKIITRKWVAKDAKGNTSKCTQTIYITRKKLSDVLFPPHFDDKEAPAFNCGDDFPMLANGNPSIDTTGFPFVGQCTNLEYNFTDTRFPMCGNGYKVVRNWFVIEWCTAESVNRNQIIEVRDKIAPLFDCPPSVTVSSDAYSCGIQDYLVKFDQTVSDCSTYSILIGLAEGTNSSDFSLVNKNGQYFLNSTKTGSVVVKYSLTDACQNVASCESTIDIIDDVAPYMVCDEHTKVALDDQGRGRLFASSLDDGTSDNCGILNFSARKMLGTCGQTTEFAPYIDFCCEDISLMDLMVELKAIDIHGNENTCMVNVTVEDKIAPKITCPPNVTIDCDAYIDSTALMSLGNVRISETDIKNITINNSFHHGVVGQDGLASDNCSVQVSAQIIQNIHCFEGVIEKVFTAADASNLKNSCTQYIYVVNAHPFTESDITWPSNFEGEGCKDGDISEDITGKPTFKNTSCSTVTASYTDEAFDIADGACQKIFRKWTVIDWCQFDENTLKGKWGPYIQVIKIYNHTAPNIIKGCSQDTLLCSYDLSCESGNIFIPFEGEDDCTSKELLAWYHYVDLGRDGQTDTLVESKNIDINLPLGMHQIRTVLTDQCGNTTECNTSLILKDCKKPTPYCYSQLVTSIQETGFSSQIWAIDFNKGSYDNCTNDADLLFTFDEAQPVSGLLQTQHYFKGKGEQATESEYLIGEAQIWNPSSHSSGKVFTCEDIPDGKQQIQTLNVSIFDDRENHDQCTVELLLQDPLNLCQDIITTSRIGGHVQTTSGVPIAGSIIECETPEDHLYVETDAQGYYEFNDLPLNVTYTIKSKITDRLLDGVSTFDLLKIQRHILGVEVFDSPYKLLAADVNDSKSISAGDLTDLRKIILGIKTSFPKGNDPWLCVPQDTVISNAAYPYLIMGHQNVLLKGDEDDVDFIAIKRGDVNESYTNPFNDDPESRLNNTEAFEFEYVMKDGMYFIDIKSREDRLIDGFQLFLNSDDWEKDGNVYSCMGNFEYAYDGNSFAIVAYDQHPFALSKGSILVSIPITQNKTQVRVDSRSEIYHDQRPLKLTLMEGASSVLPFYLKGSIVENHLLKLACTSDVDATTFSIVGMDGRQLQIGKLPSLDQGDDTQISLIPLSSGLYTLHIFGNNVNQSFKFVVH